MFRAGSDSEVVECGDFLAAEGFFGDMRSVTRSQSQGVCTEMDQGGNTCVTLR